MYSGRPKIEQPSSLIASHGHDHGKRKPKFQVTSAIGDKSYSQRRACGQIGLHTKTYRYAFRRPDGDALWSKPKELAFQLRRFGYLSLGLLLDREDTKTIHKKLSGCTNRSG